MKPDTLAQYNSAWDRFKIECERHGAPDPEKTINMEMHAEVLCRMLLAKAETDVKLNSTFISIRAGVRFHFGCHHYFLESIRNPAATGQVSQTMQSIKKAMTVNLTKRARPMTIEDMDKLYNYLFHDSRPDLPVWVHQYIWAFAVTSWTLFLRVEETFSLNLDCVKWVALGSGTPLGPEEWNMDLEKYMVDGIRAPMS